MAGRKQEIVKERPIVRALAERRDRVFTTTEEEIRLLGPFRIHHRGGRVRHVELTLSERAYTKLRKACARLTAKMEAAGIEVEREMTAASLVEVLVYWYTETDGDVDIMGRPDQ